jgi:hypothetical protein
MEKMKMREADGFTHFQNQPDQEFSRSIAFGHLSSAAGHGGDYAYVHLLL